MADYNKIEQNAELREKIQREKNKYWLISENQEC